MPHAHNYFVMTGNDIPVCETSLKHIGRYVEVGGVKGVGRGRRLRCALSWHHGT